MATIGTHMTRDVVTLDAAAPVREAARLMTDRQIGSVAVRDRGTIIGLVTERDLVASVLARGGDASMPIREAMRNQPRVSPDATEAEVNRLMREQYTRHALVEEGGKVVGVVSMRDIIQLMLDEKQFLIEQMENYIGGR